jgi:hypothetical protein
LRYARVLTSYWTSNIGLIMARMCSRCRKMAAAISANRSGSQT